ncbi:uncharacterized protein LACBIDRAFT_316244 [Laccaria bicolor S238N-H82]|uniref:Predicted protein n=1 Tax=Laccaria bicolor (strain S238N-H82 / ATCC MYA-4686) TaxID=486041 RepID=B0E0I7_LACBS|nr:uncharacterized protein LACBIDRAFT_316244 [Laccaria bicolor S238N-H82]EDQ99628.1 predicted protein [Laccaria bicolor S238N-H82]|eukprot:XP_001889739.1 predicted protein [Laccaria bicolor S238N-H82]
MGLREEREKFYDQTTYLSRTDAPARKLPETGLRAEREKFYDQTPPPAAPTRKPPETGLRAEREKFYDQTPPPAAPTKKPPETGLRAERKKFYDQASYRSLLADYPAAPALDQSQPPATWPPIWPPADCAQPLCPAEADRRQHPTKARPPSFVSPSKALSMGHESFMRAFRQGMAKSTLKDIKAGYIEVYSSAHQGTWRFDITSQLRAMRNGTEYYRPDSLRLDWKSSLPPIRPLFFGGTRIEVLHASAIAGARHLQRRVQSHENIGVLNSASPTMPGGDFLDGGNTHEASLCRSSTLYGSLNSSSSKPFYNDHSSSIPYHSNALIFSPNVVLFRNDKDVSEHPLEIDVVSCSPVNAELVRSGAPNAAAALINTKIKQRMRDRMGRILALFERRGVKHVVLGAFGVGACKNDIEMIAELWADFFSVSRGRFSFSFQQVIFAIPKQQQFDKFRTVFRNKCQSNPRPARRRVL